MTDLDAVAWADPSPEFPHADAAPSSFEAAVLQLGRTLRAQVGQEDITEVRRAWALSLAATGLAWALVPSPVVLLAPFLLAWGNVIRFAVVAHHVRHGAVERIPGRPAAWAARVFAHGGWRRPWEWLDWMPVDAWHQEHDLEHHARTGDPADPDNAEANTTWLRQPWLPTPIRFAILLALALVWKPTYYARTTIRALVAARQRRALSPESAGAPRSAGLLLLTRSWLPNVLVRFVGPTLVASAFGHGAAMAAVLLAGELLANLWGFLIIVPNHTGDDLPRFTEPPRDRDEFLRRQVVATTNFRGSGPWVDLLQGGLNHQIEHHLFADLPLRLLRLARPQLRALCAEHGVPYREEWVWTRARRMAAVLCGTANAPLLPHWPPPGGPQR